MSDLRSTSSFFRGSYAHIYQSQSILHLSTIEIADLESPDIDRGWAFVIAFSFFMTTALTTGISYPSTVFFSVFLEEFEQLPSTTAWATSLNTFAFCSFGELANVICKSLGYRAAVVVGGTMSSVGLLLTSFSPNLPCVIFAFGLLTGVGFNIVYVLSFPMVTLYFKKYRKLVFVMGSAGLGVGIFVFPILITLLIKRYHWRDVFIILSAVNLNTWVIAATYFMPRTHHSSNTESFLTHDTCENGTSLTNAQRVCAYLRYSLSLLKQWQYCIFLLSFFMFGFGLNAFFTHIGNMAITRGFSKEQAAFLTSIVGIAGIVGRLLFVLYTYVLDLNVFGLFVVHFVAMGLATSVISFVINYYAMLACCSAVGLLLSATAVYPEMVIRIIGLKNVGTGVSYACLLQGLGVMLGGPLSAWTFEVDSTYRSSFVLAGVALFLSGTMNIPFWLTCGARSETNETQIQI